jgi:hypothetical protein
VFSTYLYRGSSTVTNGIDLSTEGGLVWAKGRSGTGGVGDHCLIDTARGANLSLASNLIDASYSISGGGNTPPTFTTTGFTTGNFAAIGSANTDFASWTFRKQPKFFDVVTYTGNGVLGRAVSHNLGATPGCIIVKRTDGVENWVVYHRSLTVNSGVPTNLFLNLTNAQAAGENFTAVPTSTQFFVGPYGSNNANGGTYVAYLFAHDAGGFGLTGTDNVISCGSFTTTAGGDATVNLGYEPQWLLRKRTDTAGNWFLADNMRGWAAQPGNQNYLLANTSGAEVNLANFQPCPTATGFELVGSTSSATFIYIAIRRGPMKVPTSGTEVFTPISRTGTGANATIASGFTTDLQIVKSTSQPYNNAWFDRLRGTGIALFSDSTVADQNYGAVLNFQSNTAVNISSETLINQSGQTFANFSFRRAPGFFDVVCYTQTVSGSPYQTQSFTHNLGVIPELVITKGRSTAFMNWIASAYVELGANQVLTLTSTNAQSASGTSGGIATPTSTTASGPADGGPGDTYVAYLFASCPGVSKVGSFTGTGATQVINCGFTGGARFVLIKSKSAAGDWYVWDSARGIVPLNDPYLRLNSTAAEVTNTDWVDTAATGFELSNSAGNLANSSGVSYIFLAIA